MRHSRTELGVVSKTSCFTIKKNQLFLVPKQFPAPRASQSSHRAQESCQRASKSHSLGSRAGVIYHMHVPYAYAICICHMHMVYAYAMRLSGSSLGLSWSSGRLWGLEAAWEAKRLIFYCVLQCSRPRPTISPRSGEGRSHNVASNTRFRRGRRLAESPIHPLRRPWRWEP